MSTYGEMLQRINMENTAKQEREREERLRKEMEKENKLKASFRGFMEKFVEYNFQQITNGKVPESRIVPDQYVTNFEMELKPVLKEIYREFRDILLAHDLMIKFDYNHDGVGIKSWRTIQVETTVKLGVPELRALQLDIYG